MLSVYRVILDAREIINWAQKPCTLDVTMCRHDAQQFSSGNFYLPCRGCLRGDNRWVRLANLISWDTVEDEYVSQLRDGLGASAHCP